MANRACLLLSENSNYPDQTQDDLIIEANYSIPLLWLALFSSDDLASLPGEDGEDTPYLFVQVEKAKHRFIERETSLRNTFLNIGDYIVAWHKMLAMLEQPYVKAEIKEILWLSDDAVTTLKQALTFFDSPSESATKALLRITALDDIYDSTRKTVDETCEPHYLILGGKVAEWLPWSDSDEIAIADTSIVTILPPAQKKCWWKFWK